MSSIDLSTTYLGLRLTNPFMAGASPLADHLDTARRLEDAGCAAIVLHSLFEEQISQPNQVEFITSIHSIGSSRRSSPIFPRQACTRWARTSTSEHLRRVKEAVDIPVLGSLNGTTAETWLIRHAHRAGRCRRAGIEYVRGRDGAESSRADG